MEYSVLPSRTSEIEHFKINVNDVRIYLVNINNENIAFEIVLFIEIYVSGQICLNYFLLALHKNSLNTLATDKQTNTKL